MEANKLARTDSGVQQNNCELCPLRDKKKIVFELSVYYFFPLKKKKVNILLLKPRTGAFPLQRGLRFFSSDAIILRIRVPECLQQPCIFLSVRDKPATVHSYRAVQSLPLAVSL